MSKAVLTVTGVETEHVNVNAMRRELELLGVQVVDMRLYPDGARTSVMARKAR